MALPPKKNVKSGRSPPAMSTPILAGYSLCGTIVNCMFALSALLTACHAGFLPKGVRVYGITAEKEREVWQIAASHAHAHFGGILTLRDDRELHVRVERLVDGLPRRFPPEGSPRLWHYRRKRT